MKSTQSVRYLELSRDNWKHKAQSRHSTIRTQQVKIRDLENSREKWKLESKKLREELKTFKKKPLTGQAFLIQSRG